MARKTFFDLSAQAAATLADNTTADISPADVRTMITDFLDTMRPAYGVLTDSPTGITKLVNIAALPLAWTDIQRADSPEFTLSATNGSISRPSQTCSSRIVCSVDVYGPQGKIITGQLANNGVATQFKSTITCGGPTKPETLLITGVVTAAVNPLFQIYVNTDSDGVSFTFKDGVFAVENVPMRGGTTTQRAAPPAPAHRTTASSARAKK